jgi:predicted ATP-dependent endonuclease of OLD family
MRIEKIKIENFKGISSISEDLGGHNVFVMGQNEANKSSFIDAVWCAVSGKDIPDRPIKEGEKKALIEADLGDYKAILEFKRTTKGITKKFSLVSRDGAEIKSPRHILNSLVGIVDFNPSDFFSMYPKQQVEFMSKLVGVDLESINGRIEEASESLKYSKKKLSQVQSMVEPYDKSIISNDAPSVGSLYQILGEAISKNSEINSLKSDLENARDQVRVLNEKIKLAEDWLENEANQPIDVEKIKTEIDNIETSKANFDEAKKLKEIEDEFNILSKEVEEEKSNLELLNEEKRKIISEKINIDGLTFDGDEFLLNGLPFKSNQINTATQIITGLKIGLQLIKDVRIMRFEGTLVDNDNLEKVKEWAEENDVQLFIEVMDRNAEGLTIEIEED